LENIALFGLLALVAECIGTISGFGSSILFVPIASLFFDFKIVLGITAVFHVFSNISKIILFKKGIDKNISLKLGIPAVIFVIIGAVLTNYIPTKSIEIIMSVVLITLAIFLIFNNKYQLEHKDKNLYIGGTISGFLAGLIGTGGAIRGITMIAFNLEKNVFIATSALIDLGVDSSRAVIYIFSGYFLTEHIKLIPLLIVVSIVGTAIGKYFLKYTSQNIFRYVVLIVIIIASVFQVYKLM
jgi:uncharacterized membrane protein YfcA